jgi:hypothetical protein
MRRTDGYEKCTKFFAFRRECGGRRERAQAGPGRAGRFVGFRCGSRTLWFLASWTLCFPTLGWTLSPVTLYPRWACITCLGCRFYIFPIVLLTQCPSGCVVTIRPRRSSSMNCVTYFGTSSTLYFCFVLSFYILSCALLLLIFFFLSVTLYLAYRHLLVFYHLLFRRPCISTLLVCPHN